jgi:hypothetical protein
MGQFVRHHLGLLGRAEDTDNTDLCVALLHHNENSTIRPCPGFLELQPDLAQPIRARINVPEVQDLLELRLGPGRQLKDPVIGELARQVAYTKILRFQGPGRERDYKNSEKNQQKRNKRLSPIPHNHYLIYNLSTTLFFDLLPLVLFSKEVIGCIEFLKILCSPFEIYASWQNLVIYRLREAGNKEKPLNIVRAFGPLNVPNTQILKIRDGLNISFLYQYFTIFL